jgi:hypothetical protein
MAEEQNTKRLVFKSSPGIITWPCTISEPVSGGGRQDSILDARFKVIDDDRYNALVGDPLSKMTRPEGAPEQGDVPLLKEVLVGFADLKDENGAAVPDDVAIAAYLGRHYAVIGLVRGYMEMVGLRVSKN